MVKDTFDPPPPKDMITCPECGAPCHRTTHLDLSPGFKYVGATKAVYGSQTVWNSMDSAPRDGKMVRLLVDFEDHATEDSPDPCPTIGANNFEGDGEDVWLFAGWDWCHDRFTQGTGKPIGWLPFL